MKTIKLTLVTLLLVACATVTAQSKLAYLNSNEVLTAMPEMEEVNAKLKAFSQELEDTYKAMQAEYAGKVSEIQKNTASWSETMVAQKSKEINTLGESIQQYNEDAPQMFNNKQQELMEPVIKKVREAITAVGKENGFAYIFDSNTLLYLDETNAVNALPLVKKKLGIN